MVERYRRQVDERSTPSAFGRAYGGPEVYGAGVSRAMGPLGDAIARLAEYKQKRQDEWDAATVMNAQNEYMKRLSEWMDDPEKGQAANRKLGAARGLADDAYQYADALAEELTGQLENDAQKAAFMRISEKARLPFWKGASEYEARQVRDWQEQTFATAMATSADLVTRAPGDAFALETAREQRANAIRAHLFGAAPETVERALAESDSELDERRFSILAKDDPVGALAMVRGENALLPEARAKLEAAIGPRAEIYERQAIVDELIERFPQGSERDGLVWIRKRYSGEQEEQIASAYRQRMGELRIGEEEREASLAQQQRANFETIRRGWHLGEQRFTHDDLQAWLANGTIDSAQYQHLEGYLRMAVSRADVTKGLKRNPEWSSLTPEQQEERVMRRMGISREQREAALEWAQAGILDGSVTEAEIDAAHQNGWLTNGEAERLKGLKKKIPQERATFLSEQKGMLEKDLGSLVLKDMATRNAAKGAAIAKYNELARELDPNSTTYRKDVMEARRAALAAGIEASGKPLERSTWWGFGPDAPTRLGESAAKAYKAIDVQMAGVHELEARIEPDKITLLSAAEIEEQRAREAEASRRRAVGVGNTGNIGRDMLGGKGTITGRFADRRGYRNGQHNGLDIAAPEGTPIAAPDIGASLTVAKVETDATKRQGCRVVLMGTTPDGRSIEISASHVKSGSIGVKPGDTVKAGDVIGAVGNTGYTISGGKGSTWYEGKKGGHHLDLKVKVNGRYVDPERLVFGGTKAVPAPQAEAKAAPAPKAQEQPKAEGAVTPEAPASVPTQTLAQEPTQTPSPAISADGTKRSIDDFMKEAGARGFGG